MDLSFLTDPDKLWEALKTALVYDPAQPLMFHSGLFLGTFLFFLLGYLAVADRKMLRTAYVVLFSLFFYYKSSGFYLVLLIVSTVIDFYLGWAIYRSEDPKRRRQLLILSMVANLGMLGYFKYTNFLVGSLAELFSQPFSSLDIFLPVGISFFTFQTMSYTIDVYRGKLKPVESMLDFGFFVSFFPQLVAGPIVRAADFLPQLTDKLHISREDIGRGLLLICSGLFKKAVISDYIAANFVDRIFETPALYTGFENLMGVYGYALQIYCDFSGYSDMAIGIGLLLGFRLPLNFAAPYQSVSIREFWRRWHISLSNWLRDYLYISLGGNRKGPFRTYVNLLLTMLLGGLWHGASWRFVMWGALHGVALAVDRMTSDIWRWVTLRYQQFLDELDAWAVRQMEKNPEDKAGHWVQQFRWFSQGWASLALSVFFHLAGLMFTFHFVCFAWIFFRAGSFELAWEMIYNILDNFHGELAWDVFFQYRNVFLLMLLGYLLHFIPGDIDLWLERRFVQAPLLVKSLALALIMFLVSITQTAGLQPFIYFQF